MDSGMFYGIQKGAITALKTGPFWFDKLDEVYRRRQQLVFELAEKLECSYDENATGMFVWARLPEGASDSAVYIDEVLHGKDIFMAPGTVFGSAGEGYIRISLCVTVDKIKEAINRF